MKRYFYSTFFLLSISLFLFLSGCKKEDSEPTTPMDTTPPTVTYAGKTYNTVKIGSQTWFKENLDVGTMIPGTQDPSNNGTIEKYCYENKTENCNTYGGLYNWNEAMAYSTVPGTKGICPDGWHIPTKTEFEALTSTVNNSGNALKAIGQGTGDGAGTNESGFSALLAGYHLGSSGVGSLGYYSVFWSSTKWGNGAYDLFLGDDGSGISIGGNDKGVGCSVRCLKD